MSAPITGRSGIDWPSACVGLVVGAGGLLFVLEPVVDPVPMFGTAIRPIALSAIVLTLGFGAGTVLYSARSERLVSIAHGIATGGFGLFAAALGVGSSLLVFGGVLLLVAGSMFLITRPR